MGSVYEAGANRVQYLLPEAGIPDGYGRRPAPQAGGKRQPGRAGPSPWAKIQDMPVAAPKTAPTRGLARAHWGAS